VQKCLRQTLAQWGCPTAMRFDNGKPWGHPGMVVPTALALWLVGLGIQPMYGRPRQSTDNAVVERCHGVLEGWVEPKQCENRAMMEARLAYYVHLQREVYPLAEGQSRLQQFPALARNPHRYQPEQEEAQWDLRRVLDYVAEYTFTRMVEKNGRMTLMTHEYSLGRQYRSQRVTAQLDPRLNVWVVKDRYGEVVARFPALQLNYRTIADMTLTHKHFKAKLDGARNGAQPYGV
jgi:hypothetical protein